MPTLSEVTTLLSRYSGVGNTFLDRLNLVRARLLDDGAWPGMTPRIVLSVYEDADSNSVVTLPRQYSAILRGYVAPTSQLCAGYLMGTSGVFNEGIIGAYNHNFQEVADYFCVYREWTGAKKIRLKFEAAEAAGNIYLSGNDEGVANWTSIGGTFQQKEVLATNGAATLTSALEYDAKGFRIEKPSTLGRVSAYTLDSDGVTETLVGVYEPGETVPRWRRYRVPCTNAADDDYTYVAIVRLKYVPLVNSYEDVLPGNIGALKFGLEALLAEDARSYSEADDLWQRARDRLVRQAEAESEGTTDRVEVEDDMDMAALGRGL